MSGAGAPSMSVDGTGIKVEIVAARWHREVMDGLIAGAEAACRDAGAEYRLTRVAGTWELPAVTNAYIEGGADAVVALGLVLKGETPHFEYICNAVAHGLMEIAHNYSAAIGFGVLTCDTEAQALARAGLPGSTEDKGREAAEAAIDTAQVLRRVAEQTD